MRKYEMMLILDPEIDERTVSPFVDKLLGVVKTHDGTVENVDIWGKRRFSYPIDKKTEGIYVVIDMVTTPDVAQELDRQLGLNESVLRTKLMRPQAH